MSFDPKVRIVSDVTQNYRAEVTTTEDHGYETGYVVRLFVPPAYGMSIYESSKIVVTGDRTFTTYIDTTFQNAFVTPTFSANGQGFTQAQVVPISGTERNTL